jgi:hypothetical protein
MATAPRQSHHGNRTTAIAPRQPHGPQRARRFRGELEKTGTSSHYSVPRACSAISAVKLQAVSRVVRSIGSTKHHTAEGAKVSRGTREDGYIKSLQRPPRILRDLRGEVFGGLVPRAIEPGEPHSNTAENAENTENAGDMSTAAHTPHSQHQQQATSSDKQRSARSSLGVTQRLLCQRWSSHEDPRSLAAVES